jgi:hypothetical protein
LARITGLSAVLATIPCTSMGELCDGGDELCDTVRRYVVAV